jgi:hypothetical protein
MRAAAIVLLTATAACGGERAGVGLLDVLDATGGPGRGDAALSDDAGQGSMDGPFFGGFDAAFERYDALSMASERCVPPCAPDEFCLASVVVGGGRLELDPLDAGSADAAPVEASAGCHPLPAACAAQPTCACVLPLESANCHDYNGSGCHDDAGNVVVECYLIAP